MKSSSSGRQKISAISLPTFEFHWQEHWHNGIYAQPHWPLCKINVVRVKVSFKPSHNGVRLVYRPYKWKKKKMESACIICGYVRDIMYAVSNSQIALILYGISCCHLMTLAVTTVKMNELLSHWLVQITSALW